MPKPSFCSASVLRALTALLLAVNLQACEKELAASPYATRPGGNLEVKPDGGDEDEDEDREMDAPAAQPTCGDLDCGLHGDCAVSESGAAACTCDHGYVARPNDPGSDGICVEDLDCVTARMLGCRVGLNSSTVGVHFSLQYCSGKPYTGLDAAQVVVEEEGNQAYQALLPSESFVTVVPHDPLTHVYLVVDVSNSIQQSDVLGDLASAMQQFLDRLEGMGGQYRLSVFLFDGRAHLYPFIDDTSDLDAARARLDTLQGQVGEDPSSSNVYGAVIEGLDQLRRAVTLRNLVNSLGTLNTGTLIVVSDGDDRSSTRSLEQVTTAIDSSAANVLTVGLGDVANYPTLTSIGRDGSYSAPTPALIDEAFEQIASRIGAQRQSLYLVGYCSPKRAGTFNTRVGIRGVELERPVCGFDASHFTGTCSADNFVREAMCAGRECGEVIGCGACGDGECCADGQCVGPSTIPETARCGAEWMCAPGMTCVDSVCRLAVTAGAGCDDRVDHHCDGGAMYCASPDPVAMPPEAPVCLLAKVLGEACSSGPECESQHCGVPPSNPGASSKHCLPPAQMFDACGPNAACEPGSYCKDNAFCIPQKNAGSCTLDAECKTGRCVELGSGAKVCGAPDQLGTGACLFPLSL